jgi:hypothetical protein
MLRAREKIRDNGADIHLKINAVWLAAQTVDRIFNRKV